MRLIPLVVAAGILAFGCGRPQSPLAADPSGVITAIDSTSDTLTARVVGAVPDSAVRHLVEEVRIAPSAEDTSLFTEISEFEIDRAGRFWVFDEPSRSIFLFDSAGKLLRRIGRKGQGPGEFQSNNGMVPTADSGVAILDAQNARISVFDGRGDFRSSWRTPSGFSTNNGLRVDATGTYYLRRPVTEPREGEILGRIGLVRLTKDGRFADSLVPPDLAVARDTYLAQSKDGQSSTGAEYAPRYVWAFHPDGYFVVGHGGRFELTVARPGRPTVIRREGPPVPVSESERQEEQARITYSMRQTDPGWIWHGPALPEAKAPLLGVTITRDARIWAEVATPSIRIPDADLSPSDDPKEPVDHYRSPRVYEVFEATGRFLGRVDCTCRLSMVDADGDRLWAIVRDQSDLPAVVRFRIEPGLR